MFSLDLLTACESCANEQKKAPRQEDVISRLRGLLISRLEALAFQFCAATFLGECSVRVESSSDAASGFGTAPLITMSSALTFFP